MNISKSWNYTLYLLCQLYTLNDIELINMIRWLGSLIDKIFLSIYILSPILDFCQKISITLINKIYVTQHQKGLY